jgi:hypothetical protein
MTAAVTPEGESAITDIARRHGLSDQAVLAMLYALHVGGGTMAQFSIPELGGSGQWMRGGMTMVGNMFDNALKARVDALCNELVQLLSTTTVFRPTPTPAAAGGGLGFPSNNWWPAELGAPSSVGGQNDARYAVFPSTHRLAVHVSGVTRVFDTGEHRIGGVQQQQGGGPGTVSFTSQLGTFDVSSLREVGAQQAPEAAQATPAPPVSAPAPAPAGASGDPTTIIAAIESLAGLHERGILTDDEFAAKKAELLGRL